MMQESLERLIRKIISTISNSQDEYIPPYLGKRYSKYFLNYDSPKKNPHLYTDRPLAQRLYEEFLSDVKEEIKNLEEFKILNDRIINSNAFNKRDKFKAVWGQEFDDNFDLLFSCIWKVVKSSYEHGSFDQVVFNKEYKKLESFCNNENTSLIQILVPLHNLKSSQSNLDISQLIEPSGKLIWRSITDEEKTLLISLSGGYSGEAILSLHSSDFILEIEYYDKFYSEDEYIHEKIKTKIVELITAMRLLKSGYIGASVILFRHPLIDKTINLIQMDYDLFGLFPNKNPRGSWIVNSFQLYEGEIDDVQNILRLLKTIISKKNDLAIRRFNSAYEKTNKSDKFLDLMITYEALFSGGKSDSVGHKLALRFSRLLGNTLHEQKFLYGDMKKVYDQRSMLVHGAGDEIHPSWVEKAEEYMRKSIKEYLHVMNTNSFTKNDQFIDYLDFEKNSR
jgi:hypothetical protein